MWSDNIVKTFHRVFQSTAYYWGQERHHAMPKGDPSPEGTRSKIEYHRVHEEKFERTSLFFVCIRFGGSRAYGEGVTYF